jgi:hypothetical protein
MYFLRHNYLLFYYYYYRNYYYYYYYYYYKIIKCQTEYIFNFISF